jgi:hypothetical protein
MDMQVIEGLGERCGGCGLARGEGVLGDRGWLFWLL